jgi:hypothetical protein
MGNLTSSFCPPKQERPYSAHGFSDPPGRSVRPSPLSDGVPHCSGTTVNVAFQQQSMQKGTKGGHTGTGGDHAQDAIDQITFLYPIRWASSDTSLEKVKIAFWSVFGSCNIH